MNTYMIDNSTWNTMRSTARRRRQVIRSVVALVESRSRCALRSTSGHEAPHGDAMNSCIYFMHRFEFFSVLCRVICERV